MIIRDSSFHPRGSKDPQGISQGWLQQGLSQVKQPMVVAKQVENSVDTLVCSIFCWDFLFTSFVFCNHGNPRDFSSKVTHHCRVCKDLEAQRGFLQCWDPPGWYSVSLSSLAKKCHVNRGVKSSDCYLYCTAHGDKALWTTAGSSYHQVRELGTTLAKSYSTREHHPPPRTPLFSPRGVPANASTKGKFVFFYMRKGSKSAAQGLNNTDSHRENPAKLCWYWCFTFPKLMN